MARDSWCPGCGGMFHDDEIEDNGYCIYCNLGADSGLEDPTDG